MVRPQAGRHRTAAGGARQPTLTGSVQRRVSLARCFCGEAPLSVGRVVHVAPSKAATRRETCTQSPGMRPEQLDAEMS